MDSVFLRQFSDVDSIVEDLLIHSFAIVQLPTSVVHEFLPRVADVLDSWQEQSYDEALEIGRQMPLEKQKKEFIAVKKGLPANFLLSSAADFCNRVFDAENELASNLFCSVAKKLKISSSAVTDLLQAEIGPCEVSESFMHLFRYHRDESLSKEKFSLPCEPHTDSGLLTIIPQCLGEPGLECLSKKLGTFVCVEELFLDKKNVCTVLAGETLAALSRGKISGTVHQVRPSNRISIPFQLRTRSECLHEYKV